DTWEKFSRRAAKSQMSLRLPLRTSGMSELLVSGIERGKMALSMELQIDLPDELATFLGPDPAAAVREAVLLQLVHEERMSLASAGQPLDLDRLDAIRWDTGHGYLL